jgi:EAL domain-containing protein (putative c-di-GMP-specific phosphodiesterase class I)
MEHELRRALDRDEFALHLQPVMRAPREAGMARVVGAEALLRWNHPERGLLLPGVFLPIAEQSELMNAIGLWVLRRGCRHLRLWDEAGMPPLGLSIDLSAGQFADHELARNIAEALAIGNTAPKRLIVEMTETTVKENRDRAIRVFRDLRALGVRVAIDDFGTGYSTMSQLRDLVFDTMKIDRMFVQNIESSFRSQAICKALIDLANGLDIAVLAEGVASPAEFEQLRKLGCELFQGYYFARPMPVDAFGSWVRDKGSLAVG